MNLGLFNRKHESTSERLERLEHERRVHEEYLKARREEELLAAKRRGKADGVKGKTTVMTRLQASFATLPKSMKMIEDAIGEMPNVGGGIKNEFPQNATKKQNKQTNNPNQPIVIVLDGDKTEKKKKSLLEQVWDI